MNEIPRKEYPRPQFVRENWINLNGEWTFEFDFGKSGLDRGLQNSQGFSGTILVPFCPESKLSGVGHTDFIPAMFYHRKLEIPGEWQGQQILLHFGAVDYECEGFINGKSVGSHSGGSCSFEFDITSSVKPGTSADFVLSVLDDTRSGLQAGGKQSASYHSAGCSYTRVTGIWQTVWLEATSPFALKRCAVTPVLDDHTFVFNPEFYASATGNRLRITVSGNGENVMEEIAAQNCNIARIKLEYPRPWSPEDPFLYDVVYEVLDQHGQLIDRVKSYAGLRKIHIDGNRIFLNNKPLFQRLVLDQGYYPDSIWTAPSDKALKQDIELSMTAGFNGARLHQKVFEERFHYWADKLGYLTWGETASWGAAFLSNGRKERDGVYWRSEFQFFQEWREIVRRDYNHPSIITWTPSNEVSVRGKEIGIYKQTMRALYNLTKELDPTRPCHDSSGYNHVKTDLWTVHVYRKNAAELKEALHPANSPVNIFSEEQHGLCEYEGHPYLNDEWGGFMFIPTDRRKFAENTWGYHGLEIKNEDELCALIDEQVEAMIQMPDLCGYCYTQLTDVEQEQNGVYNYDRTPKVSPGKLAAVFGKTRKE